jgi:copper chaperone CopZ
MHDKPHRSDTNLTETMAAKIEIEPMNDPAGENRIAEGVAALDGVTDFKIKNGVVHVSYDPLTTSEKKIEHAVSAAGGKIKATESETEIPHPDLPQQPS